MNRPYKHNLLSEDLANKLSYQIISAYETKNIHHYISYQASDLEYLARLCWWGYSDDFKLSGGVVLWVNIPTDYGNPVKIEKHIRPGWTKKSLINSIKNFWVKVWIEQHLIWMRDDVYALSEKVKDHIDADEILGVEERTGHTANFDKMTEDDCDFWKIYLDWVYRQLVREGKLSTNDKVLS